MFTVEYVWLQSNALFSSKLQQTTNSFFLQPFFLKESRDSTPTPLLYDLCVENLYCAVQIFIFSMIYREQSGPGFRKNGDIQGVSRNGW